MSYRFLGENINTTKRLFVFFSFCKRDCLPWEVAGSSATRGLTFLTTFVSKLFTPLLLQLQPHTKILLSHVSFVYLEYMPAVFIKLIVGKKGKKEKSSQCLLLRNSFIEWFYQICIYIDSEFWYIRLYLINFIYL